MKRRAARLAWFLWALSFALTALYVALLVLSWGGPGPLTVEEDIAIVPVYLLMFIIFSTVGAVIASGRPENSIGWLFCGASIAMAGGFSSQLYAQYALLGRSDALAGGAAALWLSSWLGILGLFVVPTFLLFLFTRRASGLESLARRCSALDRHCGARGRRPHVQAGPDRTI